MIDITHNRTLCRTLVLSALMALTVFTSTRLRADMGTCGGQIVTLPFTDAQDTNIFFCSIAEAYFTGLTFGTTPTTYSPADPVPREQMAAFITRTLDQSLKRGNRRAALQQWWRPTSAGAVRAINLAPNATPKSIVCDGKDVWTANGLIGTVSRVDAASGRLLQTWTGMSDASAVIACAGQVFVTALQGVNTPARLYVINPEATTAGAATLFQGNIGFQPEQITFDGTFLWTANRNDFSSGGSITRIDVATALADTFNVGFDTPQDILWDGENLWVSDPGLNALLRVNPNTGAVLDSIAVNLPRTLLFDGTNLWVTTGSGGAPVKVFRAVGPLRGTLLANLSGNGLFSPYGMAFDGERVMVVGFADGVVSLFKAADFTPLGSLTIPGASRNACSDGVNFWITKNNFDILRF
ncbi:MAG: hypothetical protein ABJB97_08750 [Acidobacteriota bacterium]